MDYSALITDIFQLCILPFIGVLTTFLVKYINVKMKDVISKQDSEMGKKYLELLNGTITDCVIATTQTYVEALKKEGKFDAEAQKQAFALTFEAVSNLLTEDAKVYLTEAVGDLNLYITQRIEAEVNLTK